MSGDQVSSEGQRTSLLSGAPGQTRAARLADLRHARCPAEKKKGGIRRSELANFTSAQVFCKDVASDMKSP